MSNLNMLIDLAATMAEPDQPNAMFDVLARSLQVAIGYRLFTLMVFDESTQESARVYTTENGAYPIGGRKATAHTPWGNVVIAGKQSWLGTTKEDIRWAFPDHEKIIAMGLGSVINLAVVYDGRFLGTANLLHRAGYYNATHMQLCPLFAALLVPPYLQLIADLPQTG